MYDFIRASDAASENTSLNETTTIAATSQSINQIGMSGLYSLERTKFLNSYQFWVVSGFQISVKDVDFGVGDNLNKAQARDLRTVQFLLVEFHTVRPSVDSCNQMESTNLNIEKRRDQLKIISKFLDLIFGMYLQYFFVISRNKTVIYHLQFPSWKHDY